MAGSSKAKGRKGKIGKKKGQMLAYRNEQRHEKPHVQPSHHPIVGSRGVAD